MDFSYWYFFLLALFGAVVANSTGAGGGVVFVPAFNLLGLSPDSVIATSFAIQCFGMTAGTLAWFKHAKLQQASEAPVVWHEYLPHVLWFGVPSMLGVAAGQTLFETRAAHELVSLFKGFSILFAVSILATTYYLIRAQKRRLAPVKAQGYFYLVFVMIGVFGGFITAWLSIGVGELVAVLLILMRYPVRMAVGVAVSVSAMSVWVGVQKYLWVVPTIDWNVLVFAGPAALIGGTVAKHVIAWFTPVQLKLFIAAWILFSAIAM